MIAELLSALCLVVVLEGLFLFAAPGGWKRAAEQLRMLGDAQLRVVGVIMVAAGLIALWLVRRF